MAGRDACRVLVVDDNRDNAESLSMLVQLMGHEVSTAYDGLEAVELAARFGPDLVLLDIGLPKIDGYEVARRLRAGRGAPYLVAITGWTREEEDRRAAEAGFDEYLTKPIDPRQLESIIRRLCART